ncbi:MAG: hypothetical protein COB22_00065 [Cycloclasticus sp.]|nr:MAG: hypothetical protein COB22_00065 [Cycloclasticus sp.]
MNYNFSDPTFIVDPYPTYKIMREHDPVYKSPMGYWVLTQYTDILNALGDSRLSNQPSRYAVIGKRNINKYISAEIANNIIPFMDQPIHKEQRRLISKAYFSHLKETPPDINLLAKNLLEKHYSKGHIDLIQDFGKPLSTQVIAENIGVPTEDWGLLEKWSELFFYLFVPIPSNEILLKMEEGLALFRHYFSNLLNLRKNRPENDLISKLIGTRYNETYLTDIQIVDTCMLLFADGVENIDSAIANSIVALIEHPEQLILLQKHPEKSRLAADECLRYDPPAQLIAKIAKEDLLIQDKLIKQGEAIILVLASANRDSQYFAFPDRLDITREKNNHLTFGYGKHACIGGRLATDQIEAGIMCIVNNLNELTVQNNESYRVPRFGHRWFNSLPLSFTKRSTSQPLSL